MSMKDFHSTLAPAIRSLIEQKRAMGRRYQHGETLLGHFDRFCVEIGYDKTVLTEELIMQWKQHNTVRTHREQSQYLSYVRHLAVYLDSIGLKTYIPPAEFKSGTADPIELSSPFAPYISAFIAQKRADGYIYREEERVLYRFDRYCTEQGVSEPILSRDLLMNWISSVGTDRYTCFRQFAQYLLSIGLDAFVAGQTRHQPHKQPRILTQSELRAFFSAVDSFRPDYRSCERMAAGYSIMFRLYYCCGMRLREVCMLKVEDVNLETGEIQILNSKGHKDRVVFMHSDMLGMCRNYDAFVRTSLKDRVWFFPARNPAKPIPKTNMTRRFSYFWSMTPYGGNSAHAPTVHSLRHTFVVDRMNQWIADGEDMSRMLPYLSRYLGHKTIEETHYYYHLAAAATDIIRSRDTLSEKIIPEVLPYEDT